VRPPAHRRRSREWKTRWQSARVPVMASRHLFTQVRVMPQNPAKAGQASTQVENAARAIFRQEPRS
jgi:hypothetical protein